MTPITLFQLFKHGINHEIFGKFPSLASAQEAGMAWIQAEEEAGMLLGAWSVRCPTTGQEWEFRDGMDWQEC